MHAARARSLPSRRAAYNAYCMYPYYPSLFLPLPLSLSIRFIVIVMVVVLPLSLTCESSSTNGAAELNRCADSSHFPSSESDGRFHGKLRVGLSIMDVCTHREFVTALDPDSLGGKEQTEPRNAKKFPN